MYSSFRYFTGTAAQNTVIIVVDNSKKRGKGHLIGEN